VQRNFLSLSLTSVFFLVLFLWLLLLLLLLLTSYRQFEVVQKEVFWLILRADIVPSWKIMDMIMAETQQRTSFQLGTHIT
jgi:hypothetical protein